MRRIAAFNSWIILRNDIHLKSPNYVNIPCIYSFIPSYLKTLNLSTGMTLIIVWKVEVILHVVVTAYGVPVPNDRIKPQA